MNKFHFNDASGMQNSPCLDKLSRHASSEICFLSESNKAPFLASLFLVVFVFLGIRCSSRLLSRLLFELGLDSIGSSDLLFKSEWMPCTPVFFFFLADLADIKQEQR